MKLLLSFLLSMRNLFLEDNLTRPSLIRSV